MRRRALLSALVLLPALLAVLPAAIAAQGSTAAPWTFTPTPALRPDQHASLALLGRVWGFAKYHHPRFVVDGASADSALLDAVPRVLGVFRLWNVLEYWFPYRDLMERDRVALLRDALPGAWSAERLDDYQRVLIRLISRARDTHANLWSSLAARRSVR